MSTACALPISTAGVFPPLQGLWEYCIPRPLRRAQEPLLLFFGVGTGGAATLNYLWSRGDKGYCFVGLSLLGEAIGETTLDRGPRECLEHVMAVLKPAVTELAAALGVSRQAIYAWLRGNPISSANAAHLAELAQAADVVAAEGAAGATWIVRRPLRGGKTFFGLLKEGVVANDAARLLIQIIRAESLEREVLNKHFGERPRLSRESFERVGVPTLDEAELRVAGPLRQGLDRSKPTGFEEVEAMSTRNHYYIERTEDGRYAVRTEDSDRASGIFDTQHEAIDRAKELNPDDHPDVERVRDTNRGVRDKWRSEG